MMIAVEPAFCDLGRYAVKDGVWTLVTLQAPLVRVNLELLRLFGLWHDLHPDYNVYKIMFCPDVGNPKRKIGSQSIIQYNPRHGYYFMPVKAVGFS